MSENKTSVLSVLILGVLSIALYISLYVFNDEILAIATQVQAGDKALFLVPIAIAFVFSYIHGAFTGRFWDVLGFKAAVKK
ncbi:MAG: hypothetical protein OEZ58_19165 [Gammaproteobacteria bacterium]|nr:hypothetical protein [Gammaproteobacteria bacterium]MDH5731109.1 hypothetical protein [Gammaproteobacteria bacterium]